ncbi:hypothetical protein NLI96_g12430 [Meripilus lineatus]|uniref:Rab-GAP TBC domain-containing protein n=1 Tax=Meripilus lineatus TaxID=2056292 RepID=A0AAD5UUM1_9APHY|nr:hypothetical protein NLI96_g12430 [Physisporinus lineatus]
MASWDSNRVKRLGQLQYKMDSQGQITRRDIATLLQQGNVGLARAKAQKLIREDIYGDLLQTLEMLVGVILEHISELDRNDSPSPVVVEAASSIIFAAPHTDSRDLQITRELLIHRLGPDFAHSAIGNRDNYVSPRVIRGLSTTPPSAAWLDHYLFGIAKAHGVKWMPDLQPHENKLRVNAISEMLDPSSVPEIDIERLRKLCAHGLPEYPPWLRPRVWRLLLGTLPPTKANWPDEARKQRDNYYDLVRRLLEPFASLPPPSSPLTSPDASLLEVSKELSNVPPSLSSKLEEEPEDHNTSPLDPTATDDIKISCASALDDRLKVIKELEANGDSTESEVVPEIRLDATPEIRLEGAADPPESNIPDNQLDANQKKDVHLDVEGIGTPEISLSAPDTPTSAHSSVPTTLLASRVYTAAGAHPKHASALLRLLYIHSCLNPANRVPHIASLLVPIYSALVEEVEPQELAHIEADTFWLFETVIGEFSELEEVETCDVWMKKLGERLMWADTELAENLQAKGLDPALPHYSYRWLSPILTHTLPLPSVLTVWDALFSKPAPERDSNPKLEYLLDICASMLLCARGSLIRLGKRGGGPSGNLWIDENAVLPSTEDSAREIDDAFVEGMALLRAYPLHTVGGIDSVLQVAFDLAQRRLTERPMAPQAGNEGLGARLRNTVWNLASQANATIADIAEEEGSEEESEEEAPPQPPAKQLPSPPPADPSRLTLSSRLANTVWKGITNQSAMEEPASPVTPSPVRSPHNPISPPLPSSPLASPNSIPPTSPPNRTSKLWGYAEKFRDSDTAATLAKVSTNWRVKALDAWSKRGIQTAPSTPASGLAPLPLPSISNLSGGPDGGIKRGSLGVNPSPRVVEEQRRQSLPGVNRAEAYSPPPRPAYFAPVRDSILPEPRDTLTSPTKSDAGSDTGSTSSQRIQDSLASFVSLSRGPSPQPSKSAPRPLLLNSSSLITDHPVPQPQPQPVPHSDNQWADTVRAKRPAAMHRNSQSSISSSPSEQVVRPRRAETVWPPVDTSASRIVPLHRKTPSPLPRNRRNMSVTLLPSNPSPQRTHRRMPTDAEALVYDSLRQRPTNGSSEHDSTATVSPPPPPHTPTSTEAFKDTIHGPDLTLHVEDSESSITRVPTRSARSTPVVKRYTPRPGSAFLTRPAKREMRKLRPAISRATSRKP